MRRRLQNKREHHIILSPIYFLYVVGLNFKAMYLRNRKEYADIMQNAILTAFYDSNDLMYINISYV